MGVGPFFVPLLNRALPTNETLLDPTYISAIATTNIMTIPLFFNTDRSSFS